MSSTPKPIHDAAAAFDSLPGIGPRAALRFAYWLAAQPKDVVLRFGKTFEVLAETVKQCATCGLWSENENCYICLDKSRDQTVLCVVATSQDVRVIEESGAYKGRYHVLGGLIEPIEGKTPDTLNIKSLINRLSSPSNTITEILLALDPDVPGDMTALYLAKQLSGLPINFTRLARGLQHGAQIEYADGATISDAIKNRKNIV
ncbi:MAG: recombination mediator RecR [Patescibacteria group bacterium]